MERKPQANSVRLDRSAVLPLIQAALKEDIGARDLTTAALISKGEPAEAEIVVRQEGVIAGLPVAEWAFGAIDPRIRMKLTVRDGQQVYPGKAVALLEGPARGILAGERVALNFLGHLSGIATLTRAFVERIKGTPAKVFDTRKTTPGLRLLEKYAVAAGGGMNHRLGLYDGILIKENHLRLIAARISAPVRPEPFGGAQGRPVEGRTARGRPSAIERAISQVRAKVGERVPVEVEVATLQEFRQALSAQPDLILLDNMELKDIQEAVRLRGAVARSKKGRRILLEVSGGITLDTVRPIAQAGVDRISVGALTHSAPSLDVALEMAG